jgi:hypothetical protein
MLALSLTSVAIAVPTWMPLAVKPVMKALGSGCPVGVFSPVRYLPPLRSSIYTVSNESA